VGVLLVSGYLDYHLSRRDQIDLFMNRNIYLAKQIDTQHSGPTERGQSFPAFVMNWKNGC
jgi:hypothetical protein